MFPFIVNDSLNNNNVQRLKPGAGALTLEMPRLLFVVCGSDLSFVKNLKTQTLTLCDCKTLFKVLSWSPDDFKTTEYEAI